MASDRLVTLFLQAMHEDEDGDKVVNLSGKPPPDAIERGVASVQKVLTSDDAIRAGASLAATYTVLGMALEEKPYLEDAAVRCYERALDFLHDDGRAGWERCVVLQQVGQLCLKHNRTNDAERLLRQCAEETGKTEGHPRDVKLFAGAFSTGQTRSEFASTIAKLRAKTYFELKDEANARAQYNEAKRLEAVASGDAVERAVANSRQGAGPPAAPREDANDPKRMWAATPDETHRLTEYWFSDEGPTVLLIVNLREHVGLDGDAVGAVASLQQFRVSCKDRIVDIGLRLRRANGCLCHYQLRLDPLTKEIVPEDTVPKLRGSEGKRRLEVKLFKKEKDMPWGGLVTEKPKAKAKASAPAPSPSAGVKAPKAPPKAARGTALNPLTAAELAALPTPGGGNAGDNRPSAFVSPNAERTTELRPAVAVPEPVHSISRDADEFVAKPSEEPLVNLGDLD